MRYSINNVHGEIDSLPGCTQVAVSHSVFIPKEFRGNGEGTIHRSLKEAEQARRTKINPEQYTVTRVNLVKGWLAKLEGIEDQDVFKEDLF